MAEGYAMNPLRFLAQLAPVSLAALLAVLVNLPVSATAGLLPPPVLALAPIYFWTLARPDLMPPLGVLLLGLLEDLLSGGPPGLWAAGFLAAYALADRQRETFAGLSGIGAIFGFSAAALTAAASAYLLGSLIYWRWAPPGPVLLQSLVTILFYPPLAYPMSWLQRHVVGAQRGT